MPPRGSKKSTVRRGSSSRSKRGRQPSPLSSSPSSPSYAPSSPSSNSTSPPTQAQDVPPVSVPDASLSKEFEACYTFLESRGLIPTRYIDDLALQQLGLHDEVMQLVRSVGWETFVERKYATYLEPTLEFLSSFSTNFSAYVELPDVWIAFRCMGTNYRFNLDTWNGLLGFPNHGCWTFDVHFNSELAWRDLTPKSGYQAGRSKASNLTNPALRYLHRFLVHSLFGRGESLGAVSRYELFCLHCMSRGIPLNGGAWFLYHLKSVVKANHFGKICVGGLLTGIACSLGFVPVDGVHRRVPGCERVDVSTLVNMRMCRRAQGGYELLDCRGNVVLRDRSLSADTLGVDVVSKRLPPVVSTVGPSSSGPSSMSSSSGQTSINMMDVILAQMRSMQSSIESRLSMHMTHSQQLYDSLSERLSLQQQELASIRAQLAQLVDASDEDED